MTDKPDPANPFERLRAVLSDRLGAESLGWLTHWMERVAAAAEPLVPLAACFPTAARRLGDDPLGSAGTEIETPCGVLDVRGWCAADAGRACLLGAAVADKARTASPADPIGTLLRPLFRDGDEGERVSLVRALCLIPDPCSALPLAREAGRITSLRLYSALALNNPFPAACYDERDFNGMVLKCLFNALPVGRILGLARRANPALARLCEDYRDERVLAGRSVPADIWLALVPHASERGLGLALAALEAEDPAHRYHAALALSALPTNAGVGAALAARRDSETDPRVLDALSHA